jgi:hypothetical protein
MYCINELLILVIACLEVINLNFTANILSDLYNLYFFHPYWGSTIWNGFQNAHLGSIRFKKSISAVVPRKYLIIKKFNENALTM